jgi:hypothetical protein
MGVWAWVSVDGFVNVEGGMGMSDVPVQLGVRM